MSRDLNLWVSGCCHVGTDMRVAGRRSLADAIVQSESGGSTGPRFDWDIGVHLGDFSGSQTTPGDEEGMEVVRQFGALKEHAREDFYCLAGNHDATTPGEEPQWWFRKWIDPEGVNTQFSGVGEREYPIEGDWERYSFRVGNVLFLMMSDRNHVGPPIGRGQRGGYPAGAVSEETFRWWRDMVEENRDCLVVSAHHHVLKETTVASGPWEGFRREGGEWRSEYHGYFPDGAPEGASYLYYVGDKPDSGTFERYLAANPGSIDLWLGAHTHTSPEDRRGGRSHVESKWGVTFVNAAALTRYHVASHAVPMSRLVSFREGSDRAVIRCYLHTSDFADQGWYAPAERTLKLSSEYRNIDS